MPYTGYNGQEIEDLEMDNMRRESRESMAAQDKIAAAMLEYVREHGVSDFLRAVHKSLNHDDISMREPNQVLTLIQQAARIADGEIVYMDEPQDFTATMPADMQDRFRQSYGAG